MPALLNTLDPDGLLEYSVVYTDRSLNHMSQCFQTVINEISTALKQVYNAQSTIVVPGSGTFAMEAVARQFATGKTCLVIRNGWFSYRWSQIFEMGKIPAKETVIKARAVALGAQSAFAPAPVAEVVAAILAEKPDVVFAPHVETSAGIILPDDYICAITKAVHSVGGIFVLDCIASGTIWVDMKACGVDVLISAPQKGWSGPPCAGLVMLSELARDRIDSTTSSSFSCDLRKWLQIMETYESGGHAYHATMPTDSLARFRDVIHETVEFGLVKAKIRQQELGDRVRDLFQTKAIKSVAAPGFTAPGVIVSYTTDPEIQTGKKFMREGVQIAAGVPLKCDEPDDFQTFRIGLFGLDKLMDLDRTINQLDAALSHIF